MPREVAQELLDCLHRPNPYVELRVEISTPDVGLVLRRPDQFIGDDSPIVAGSMDPAASLVAGEKGLELAVSSEEVVSIIGEQSSFDLNLEDAQRRLKGVSWIPSEDFTRARIRAVRVKVKRTTSWWDVGRGLDFELQVYRVTKTPGVKGTTQFIDYAFAPVLSSPAVIRGSSITWAGSPPKAVLEFNLDNNILIVDGGPPDSVSPLQTTELKKYYFVVRPINPPSTTGLHSWMIDTVTSRTVAGVGAFQRSFWGRDADGEQWVEQTFSDCPYIEIDFASYPVTGQAIYEIDLGRDPSAGTIGRAVFERFLPPGTSAELEISAAGDSGPWTAILNEDEVAPAQQVYHLRVTLDSDSEQRSTPSISAMGIEFRTPVDVSLESITEFPSRQIEMPWGKASIAEGQLSVLRTGIRDYLDTASIIGSTKPSTKLEADIFLASRHPLVTRDKWCRLERLNVSNRFPGPTSEAFTLLAYSSKLKRKIPQRTESVNTVHTVTASTTSEVTVTPVLPGATMSGDEYAGFDYYMRVRSSATTDIPSGFRQQITGNSDVDKLTFSPDLPAALTAGDVIEVHSGAFGVTPLIWEDYDPSLVWSELLDLIGIPLERIGHGGLPRGGLPPTLAERAPGDTATQDLLKVTNKITEQKAGDALLDAISAVMGGATIEVDGQICWVQLYPVRDASGAVVIALPAPVRTFDLRDIVHGSLSTPIGLEARGTVIQAGYAQNLAAADPSTFPVKTTVVVDDDALAWLNKQDLEDVGASAIPDEIAQWCYNSTDEGLYLATLLASNVVRATSTGLRLFPFSVVDMQPDLLPGDPVVLITDQYTDYDPSTDTPLKGSLAMRGVLVTVGSVGRVLRIFVQEIVSSPDPSGGKAEVTG